MPPPALIFDLDGTIWDSRRWYADAIGGQDEVRQEQSLQELCAVPARILLRRVGLAEGGFRSFCESAQPPPLFPGVRETLDRLVEDGRRIATATNLPLWMAEPMLERTGLREALSILVSHLRAGRGKPHPDQLLFALNQLGVSPSDAWYVGDMPNDCLAAHAADVRFAWAAYGEGSCCGDSADAIVTRFDQVVYL